MTTPATVTAPGLKLDVPALLASRSERVFSTRAPAGRVWFKRADPPRSPWRYRALNLLTVLARTPALRAVPRPGGAQGLATEVARLEQLAQAGLTVPRVLARGDGWLCLSDLGERMLLRAIQDAPDDDARLLLWQRGLAAIVDAHRRGAYLSQCFARNMILAGDGSIGFIDFEDDPGALMPLADAQARDWAFYLFSTAACLPDVDAAVQVFHETLTRESAAAVAQTRLLLRRMRWLARLPRARLLGRDAMRAQAAGAFARAAA